MNHEFELQIENEHWKDAVVIYIRKTDHRGVCLFGMKDGELIEQRLDPHTIPQEPLYPLIRMRSGFYNLFLEAMAEHISRKGISTEKEHQLAGKLQATEKHLEDLRGYFDKALNKILAHEVQ